MKNKKLFILPLIASFGLAACGGSKKDDDPTPPPPPPAPSWSEDIQEEMMLVLGEVLPYAEFNEETIFHDYVIDEDEGAGAFVVYDDNEENVLVDYGDLLVEAGYTATQGTEGVYYAKVNEDGDQIYVEFDWFEADEEVAAGNQIYAEIYYAPEALDGIPTEDVIAFYEAFDIEGVVIPDFETATGSFYLIQGSIEDENLAYGVNGSSHDEMDAYAAALIEAGWDLKADEYGDYVGLFGDTLAEVYVADYIGYTLDCIVIQFRLGVPFSSEWPAEEISSIFEENEYDEYEFPAFVGENVSFFAEVYLFWGILPAGVQVTVRGATETEIEAFLETTLPEAGWTVTGNAESGMATKIFEEFDGVATVEFSTSGEDFIIVLNFGFSAIPGAEFPSEDLAEAFETLGVTPFTIPGPDGEGYTYEYSFDESNLNYLNYPAYCYDNMYINNMSEEQFNDYLSKLGEDGWVAESISSTSVSYELTKHFDEGFTATIRLSWFDSETYGQYASLRIYYVVTEDPSTEWPADEIAAILGEGVTDVLPEFVFEGAGFVTYDDSYGKGVSCFVGEENVEQAMEDYAAVLVEAGFILDEDSGLYASPNGQFFVEIYEGIDGAVGLEFTFPLLPGFINDRAEAFLATRGVEGATLPDFTSLEDSFLEDETDTYYYVAYFDGDVTSEIAALLTAAGYDVPETPSDYGYECLSSDGLVEIDFKYSEYGYSYFVVYSYADL